MKRLRHQPIHVRHAYKGIKSLFATVFCLGMAAVIGYILVTQPSVLSGRGAGGMVVFGVLIACAGFHYLFSAFERFKWYQKLRPDRS